MVVIGDVDDTQCGSELEERNVYRAKTGLSFVQNPKLYSRMMGMVSMEMQRKDEKVEVQDQMAAERKHMTSGM